MALSARLILFILVSSLYADDNKLLTTEQLQVQLVSLKSENDRLSKLLSAYQQQFFACTAQLISDKTFNVKEEKK